MILYCVRHGQSAFNAEGRIQGQLDTPLSELGHRQSQAVAQALTGIGITALFASPLERAMSTARPVAQTLGLEIRTDPRLMEINAGVFQGKVWSEIEREFPEAARAWKAQEPDFRIPQGESRRDLLERGRAALEAIRDAGHERAAVVAHGGLLTAALKGLLDIPAQRNPFSLHNCSISQFAWQPQFRLFTLNETAHLREVNAGQNVTAGDL
jgi:2,3-bisphosphoglycerate-dependent phosphoglycerate mutase